MKYAAIFTYTDDNHEDWVKLFDNKAEAELFIKQKYHEDFEYFCDTRLDDVLSESYFDEESHFGLILLDNDEEYYGYDRYGYSVGKVEL